MTTWACAILQKVGAKCSANNLNKMAVWNTCEGNYSIASGQPSGLGINNPMNTKQRGYGGVPNPANGVTEFPTLAGGVQANADTINQTWAAPIKNNLVNDGSNADFVNALAITGWGTQPSCVSGYLGTGQTHTPAPGNVTGNGSTTPSTGPSYEGQVTFTYTQLEGLWIAAGGSPQTAAMAGAIAMAESSGNAQATHVNSNGTTDRGLWQINSSNGSGSSTDVMTNVRAAIAMSNNGQNWRPWCTAWNGGCCGCGTYLGSGAPYQAFYNPSVKPDTTVPLNSTSGATNPQTPSGYGTTAATAPAQETGFNFWNILGRATVCTTFPLECLGVQAATTKDPAERFIVNAIQGTIFAMLNPFIQIIAGGTGMIAGGGMMILGMYMIINQTDTGQEAIGAGKKVAGAGLMLAAPEAAPEEAAAAEGAKVRTWTTTKPAGARTPARTFQTTQTTTRQPGGTHTRTVKQQLNDEARVHTSGNEPVSKLNTSTQGPPGWWRSA